MTKYQIYSHYKLPITKDPLKYGKLLDQTNNKFIVQLTTKNVAVINHYEKENFIRIFKNGDLVLEFRDKFINEISFLRTLNDTKFLFENDKLISTQISNALGSITIYNNSGIITPLYYTDSNSIQLKHNNNPLLSLLTYLDKVVKNFKKSILDYCKNLYWFYFILYPYLAIIFIGMFCFITLLILHILYYLTGLDSWISTDKSFVCTSLLNTSMKGNIVKLRKTKSINSWESIEFSIDNLVFNSDLFKNKFNQFWAKVQDQFNENNHMFILFKIKYKGSDYSTIGNLQRISQNDKLWYLNWIINNMISKSEYYNETSVESFIFSYGFKNEKIANKEVIALNVNHQKYKNNKLTISYNPLDFGRLITEINLENYTQFILQTNDNLLVIINKFKEYNEINLISMGQIILEFKDEFISNNKFVRILDNKKFYFEDNKEILFVKEMKNKFIAKLKPTKNLNNNFITLDVETYIKDSILIVYCISIFDGIKPKSFFLDDYRNVEELIITALKSIMIRKYNSFNVYIHNMAKFDIIFLLKYLVKLGSVNPVIHNDRIICINFNFGKDNEYQIQFRDSYLILLTSLMKLCKSFSIKMENSKSVFPHFFVNENNLDYIGEIPDIKYFNNISLDNYNNYKSKYLNWNLKKEAIKYCDLDCISLHQVITKFAEMIFDLFSKNVHHYPTLPSLAFGIFRSKFMTKENIPQLSGNIADDIRSGYTGGSCDVFIPVSDPNKILKCYDVNSLYPSQMRDKPMPIGKPTYFNGNIRSVDPNAFGFFYCEIIAPDNIKHPILQTHVKTNGTRTIAPIGTWEDMIFSAEMDNAIKYGYKFNILWGYTFERKYLFKDYVDFLYNFRINYPKSDPLNFIGKILLNSLYGRFGMDDNFSEINIIHKDYLADFENKFLNMITNKTELDDYFMVETVNSENILENDESTHNINVAIAAAITAYARIHMSQFKNNPDFKLFYTDTDSIYINKPLHKSFISENVLGKMKLEYILKKAIFLSPKVYYLETIDGKIIYKVKGLKHEIELTRNDFEQLLYKDRTIQKVQTKWIKKLSEGHISLLDQMYTLQVTDNKRKLIYDENNKFINTTPYIKITNEIINK